MRKRQLMLVVPVVSMTLISIFSPMAFGADRITSPTLSPSVTQIPTASPSSTVSLSPNPSPSTLIMPTPSFVSPIPTRQVPTATPQSEFMQPLVDTPTPEPTVTPTQKPNSVASVNDTVPPPSAIAKSLINFPKKIFSYIAPKDVYGTSTLPLSQSLELLGLGCILVLAGMFVLRWEEGDRWVTTELKHIGIVLRSWLL